MSSTPPVDALARADDLAIEAAVGGQAEAGASVAGASTTHRVSPPRDPRLRSKARVSFPMAIYLWEDEVLEVLPGLTPAKYPPIKALPFHTRITSKYYGDDYAVEENSLKQA